jgi:hypothetical protein
MSIDDQIKNNTCESRIDEHLDSRNQYMLEMMQAIEDEESFDGYEDAHDAFMDYPLDISTEKYIRVQISTGGPGDWLEIYLNGDDEITRVEYHFNDWFDHAYRVLDSKTPMYEYAERICEYILN